jgi:nicotinate-nucleotide adenylyltransferase
VRRIGVLGGTFDPPHIGHLMLAENTREGLDLERVLFVPVGEQPLKPDTRTTSQQRLAMVELAIADNPNFEISLVDMQREGPHYTADTLTLIQGQFPDAQLYFLMGGDNLRDFYRWTRAKEVYQQARLAVLRRSDEDIHADMHSAIFPDLADRIDMVDTPLLSIWLSSTHIVERIREDLSVRYLVPTPVLDYIRANHLYED